MPRRERRGLALHPCASLPLLLTARSDACSIPCPYTGPCPKPIPIAGIGSDCAAGPAAAALDQTLQALNSTLTALDLSSLIATYYCIPTVPLSYPVLAPVPMRQGLLTNRP